MNMLTNSKPVILIPTINKDEARRFYESTLGLTFKYDDNFALVFDTAGIMLRLTPVKEFTPHPFSVLGWEVDDIAAAVSELLAKGVKFEVYDFPWMEQDEQGVWAAPDGTKVAWFKDPDGNLLSVAQHAI
jgi:catechol 2,3-dioxygenase-like lactoylglutathione lyase family enzyme